MATKKAPAKPTATATKSTTKKPVLQNLAARPTNFDDTIDEQMVDHSGVFRVTSAIKQAQTGHDEETGMLRYPNESLVMAAQREGFRERPGEDTIDEAVVEDEASLAAKRQRLATLAARNEARAKPRRR
jgi:hypothetical protein